MIALNFLTDKVAHSVFNYGAPLRRDVKSIEDDIWGPTSRIFARELFAQKIVSASSENSGELVAINKLSYPERYVDAVMALTRKTNSSLKIFSNDLFDSELQDHDLYTSEEFISEAKRIAENSGSIDLYTSRNIDALHAHPLVKLHSKSINVYYSTKKKINDTSYGLVLADDIGHLVSNRDQCSISFGNRECFERAMKILANIEHFMFKVK